MSKSIVLAADPSRLASLPAAVLESHPSRMLLSGPRRRLALRASPTSTWAPRPRSLIALLIRGPSLRRFGRAQDQLDGAQDVIADLLGPAGEHVAEVLGVAADLLVDPEQQRGELDV